MKQAGVIWDVFSSSNNYTTNFHLKLCEHLSCSNFKTFFLNFILSRAEKVENELRATPIWEMNVILIRVDRFLRSQSFGAHVSNISIRQENIIEIDRRHISVYGILYEVFNFHFRQIVWSKAWIFHLSL